MAKSRQAGWGSSWGGRCANCLRRRRRMRPRKGFPAAPVEDAASASTGKHGYSFIPPSESFGPGCAPAARDERRHPTAELGRTPAGMDASVRQAALAVGASFDQSSVATALGKPPTWLVPPVLGGRRQKRFLNACKLRGSRRLLRRALRAVQAGRLVRSSLRSRPNLRVLWQAWLKSPSPGRAFGWRWVTSTFAQYADQINAFGPLCRGDISVVDQAAARRLLLHYADRHCVTQTGDHRHSSLSTDEH